MKLIAENVDEKLALSCFHRDSLLSYFFRYELCFIHSKSTCLSFTIFLNDVVKSQFHSPGEAWRIFSETLSGAFCMPNIGAF